MARAHELEFRAAGTGAAAAAPALDGVYQLGWAASGVGGAELTGVVGLLQLEFTAAGLGAAFATPQVGYVTSFTAAGIGAMLLVRQLGGDDLEPIGPNLLNTDPLFLVLTLSGDVTLRPSEQLA